VSPVKYELGFYIPEDAILHFFVLFLFHEPRGRRSSPVRFKTFHFSIFSIQAQRPAEPSGGSFPEGKPAGT
jgi:hypothetical protein